MLNYNGTLSENKQEQSLLQNRGLHYGDAVFETIKVSAGKVLFWEDHYFRLMAAMRVMRMEIPMNFTMEFLEAEILKTVATFEKTGAQRVKLLVWRQWGGKYTPTAQDITYALFAETLEQPFYLLNESHYEVELFKDHYITSGLLSTLKHNNRPLMYWGVSLLRKMTTKTVCCSMKRNKWWKPLTETSFW